MAEKPGCLIRVKPPMGGKADGRGRLAWKLALDFAMTALVVLEFAFDLTGSIIHEVIGLVLLLLFVLHSLLNLKWFAGILKGRYGLRRSFVCVINLLVLAVSLLLLGSGLLNASLLEILLHFKWSFSTREVHSLAGYWFLLAMAVHVGLHWNIVVAECRRWLGFRGVPRLGEKLVLRLLGMLCLIEGGRAALRQDLLARLLADYSFSYWDEDAVLRYFADFAAMIAGVVVLAHLFRTRLLPRAKG